jgi:uncharacterized membrane protein
MPDFHPVVVHFPIALLTFSLAVELLGPVLRSAEATLVGWWTQLGGTAGILFTVTTGMIAKPGAGVYAAGTLATHEQLAFLTSAIMLGLTIWRTGRRGKIPEQRALFLGTYAAGVALVWLTAGYGGEIVHRYGILAP